MKKFIHFLISITVFIQAFPVFASADALYDEPNDTLFFRQWYYDATKAYVYRNNGIDGKGVKVGVIDSGLNTFLDFDGVDIQTGINVCALIDNNNEKLYNTEDSGHHGTNVTSIICAKSDNDYGIAGLTDGVTLVPYKAEDFDCSTLAGGAYSILVALDLAYRDGCDVVNISMGNLGDTRNPEVYDIVVDKAIQNGMIILAATGNSGENGSPIEYPANCDNVIGVGGLEPNCSTERVTIDLPEIYGDRNAILNLKRVYPKESIRNLADNEYSRYSTSTANESVFISAPGTGFTLPSFKNGTVNCWGGGSGTSYATPIVAAAAIGAKQMRPYIDVDMFKEILIATSTDLDAEGYDINTGYGMVNFEKIYEYVSQMPLTAPERTPNVQVDCENGKLTNFCPNREYSVNGVNIGTPEYDDSILGIDKNIGGNMDIPEEWYGTTVEIVKLASSDAYTDSEPQLLEIPARAEEPRYEVLEKGNGWVKVKFLTDCEYKNENSTTVTRGYANDTVTLKSGMNSIWTPKSDTLMASNVISIFVDEPEITNEYLEQAQNALNSLYIKGYSYTSGGEKVYKYGNGYTRFYGCDDKFDYIVNDTQIKNNDNVTQDMFGTTVTVSINGTDLTREVYIPTTEEYEAGMELPSPIATSTPEPTPEPTSEPTPEPSVTVEPTAEPTSEPTAAPDIEATAAPTAEPTVEPTAEPTVTPDAEATSVPSAEPTAAPTATPTAEPTAVPTTTPTVTAAPEHTPTVEPTAIPTAIPTVEPTDKPVIGDLTIDYAEERIVGLYNNIYGYTVNGEDIDVYNWVYPTVDFGFYIKDEWFGTTVTVAVKGTDISEEIEIPAKPQANVTLTNNNILTFSTDLLYKEESAADWQNGLADSTVELEQGKTYVFQVPYTNSSFASEIRTITVALDLTQYDIETYIRCENGVCTYSAVNNTIWAINATGIIAVYGQNGVLKHVETVDTFPADKMSKTLDFALSEGDTVEWLVWDSLNAMKPVDKVKLDKYVYTVE